MTAIELHDAFRADAAAARERFAGGDLRISGEVAQAAPRFIGTTMQGEMEVEPRIYFRTALDSIASDIKYVVVEGSFDHPTDDWVLDPRIQVGSTARVECPGSTLRWTDPGLYLEGCRLDME